MAGAPGSGKSNFCYHLLDALYHSGVKFLVVEPAKGEYAGTLGGWEGVTCFGTNPMTSRVLSINPFAFPPSISATEHMEALLNLLSTCWPMYAAMSAILKQAMIRVYEEAGWDLELGCSMDEEPRFPTFRDLMAVLPEMIERSDYSDEVKGNYKGALLTRVQSMTNGTNQRIFCRQETGDEVLFNGNVILDLSHVGSQETLALIMGVLVLRLDEFRRSEQLGSNLPLRHVTVLEEAHNLLSARQVTAPGEGASVGEKSVEMITRAIAQMRTYGEGFLIVDQTPSALSEAVNSNTSTKVIFNLPESRDREAMGRAVSLNAQQMDEVASLGRGVCILRSRGFLAPVQLKVDRFPPERARPWAGGGEFRDLRQARGHAALLLLRTGLEAQEDLLRALEEGGESDRALVQAVRDRPGPQQRVKLLRQALREGDWFVLPQAQELSAWDEDMRRKLGRFVHLTRKGQNDVLEWLLRLHLPPGEGHSVLWAWLGNYGRFRGGAQK